MNEEKRDLEAAILFFLGLRNAAVMGHSATSGVNPSEQDSVEKNIYLT